MSLDNNPFDDDDINIDDNDANMDDTELEQVVALNEDENNEEGDIIPVISQYDDIPNEDYGDAGDEGMFEELPKDGPQWSETDETPYFDFDTNPDVLFVADEERAETSHQDMDISESAIPGDIVGEAGQQEWEEKRSYSVPEASTSDAPQIEKEILHERQTEEEEIITVDELIGSDVLIHRLNGEVNSLKKEISQLYPELELLKNENVMLQDKVEEMTQLRDAANVCVGKLEQTLLEITSAGREGGQQACNSDSSNIVPLTFLPKNAEHPNLVGLPPLDTIDLLVQIEDLQRINVQQSNQLIAMAIEKNKWKEEAEIHRQVTLGALAKRYSYLTVGVWEKENKTGGDTLMPAYEECNSCNDWIQRGKQLSLYFTGILSRPCDQLADTFANLLMESDSGVIREENQDKDKEEDESTKISNVKNTDTQLYSVKHLIDYVVACGYELEQQKLKLDAQRLRSAVGELLYEQKRKRKIRSKLFSNSNAHEDSNDISSCVINDDNHFSGLFNSDARDLVAHKILAGVKRAREETTANRDHSYVGGNYYTTDSLPMEAIDALDMRDAYIEKLITDNEKLISALNVSLSMNTSAKIPSSISDTRNFGDLPLTPSPKGTVEVSVIALETLRDQVKQIPALRKELIDVQNRLNLASKLANVPLSPITDYSYCNSVQESQSVSSHMLPILSPLQLYKEACGLYYRRCVELTKVIFECSPMSSSSSNKKIDPICSSSSVKHPSSLVDKAMLEYQKCILKLYEKRIKSLEVSHAGLQAQLLSALTLYFDTTAATATSGQLGVSDCNTTDAELTFPDTNEVSHSVATSRDQFNEWSIKFMASMSKLNSPSYTTVSYEGETETTAIESLPEKLADVLQNFFSDKVVPEANRMEGRSRQYMAVLLKALLEADDFITHSMDVTNIDVEAAQNREVTNNIQRCLPSDGSPSTTEKVKDLYQSIVNITTSTLPEPYSCPRIALPTTALSADVQRRLQNDLLPNLNKTFSNTLQKALSRANREQQLLVEEINWLKEFVCKQLSDASSGSVDISESLLNDVINRKKELQECIQKLARTEMSRKNLENAARKGAEDTKKLRAATEKELSLTQRIKELEQHLTETKHEAHKIECSLKETQIALEVQRMEFESKFILMEEKQQELILAHQLEQQEHLRDLIIDQGTHSRVPEDTPTNVVPVLNDLSPPDREEHVTSEDYNWDSTIDPLQPQENIVNIDNIEDTGVEHDVPVQDHQDGITLTTTVAEEALTTDEPIHTSSIVNESFIGVHQETPDVEPSLEARLNYDNDIADAMNSEYILPQEYDTGDDDNEDDKQANFLDNTETEESGLGSVW